MSTKFVDGPIWGLTALVVILFTITIWGIKQNYNTVEEVHTAICQVQGSYRDQINSSKKFLRKHPNGLPKLGFNRQLVERNIKMNEQRLNALEAVKCSG